jgi:hypothetical protein
MIASTPEIMTYDQLEKQLKESNRLQRCSECLYDGIHKMKVCDDCLEKAKNDGKYFESKIKTECMQIVEQGYKDLGIEFATNETELKKKTNLFSKKVKVI